MNNGFSLFELLVAIVISALTLASALPLASGLIDKMRAHSDANLLHTTLQSARFHAVTNGAATTVQAGQGGWSSGWRMFVDSDNDLQPDAGQPILIEHRLSQSKIVFTRTLQQRVRFLPDGHAVLNSGGFQAGTFSICQKNTIHSYDLIINRIGRVRRSELERNPKCSNLTP